MNNRGPNTQSNKYSVGVIKGAIGTSVSVEIADIVRNYNINMVWQTGKMDMITVEYIFLLYRAVADYKRNGE